MVDECRELAETIVHPVSVYINRHSTTGIERAVLRLLGFEGTMAVNGNPPFPVANLIVESIDKKQM